LGIRKAGRKRGIRDWRFEIGGRGRIGNKEGRKEEGD
jgi:hypothetical protein